MFPPVSSVSTSKVTFPVGSVVELKSGSDKLTVEKVEDSIAHLYYFKKGSFKEVHLPVEMLKIVGED